MKEMSRFFNNTLRSRVPFCFVLSAIDLALSDRVSAIFPFPFSCVCSECVVVNIVSSAGSSSLLPNAHRSFPLLDKNNFDAAVCRRLVVYRL